MTQIKLIQAYQATETLADNTNLSDETQWNIYKLRKELFPHIEFYNERINSLQEKYSKFADNSGNLTGEKAVEYKKELSDLNNMDKDTNNINKFTIHIGAGNGITAHIMEALEEFAEFTK